MSTTQLRRAPAPVKTVKKKDTKGAKKKRPAAPKKTRGPKKPAKKTPAKTKPRKKSAKQFLKEISEKNKKRNEQFKKLSDRKKRIAIAQEVLTQVELGKIKPETGSYMLIMDSTKSYKDSSYDLGGNYVESEGDRYLKDREGEELQTVLQEPTIKCECCALGSMAVCDILKRDEFKITEEFNDDNDSRERAFDRLSPYFSDLQLDMIETAFEMRVIEDSTGNLSDNWWGQESALGKKCVKFGTRYSTPEGRLRGIMRNIIKNNGEFKP